MVLDDRNDDCGEKKKIHDPENAQNYFLGHKRPREHKNNANPDPEKPRQAQVIGRFTADDLHDERDIEQRHDDGCRKGKDPKWVHMITKWSYRTAGTP
jgi:hypothetical protein